MLMFWWLALLFMCLLVKYCAIILPIGEMQTSRKLAVCGELLDEQVHQALGCLKLYKELKCLGSRSLVPEKCCTTPEVAHPPLFRELQESRRGMRFLCISLFYCLYFQLHCVLNKVLFISSVMFIVSESKRTSFQSLEDVRILQSFLLQSLSYNLFYCK